MSDDITRQIEDDVRRLELHSSSTAVLRKKVIDKLAGAVDAMKLDANADKASMIDAKMNMMSTFLRALDDSEKRPENLIKLKQKIKADKQSEATMNMISNTVVEYMRRLGSVAPVLTMNDTGNQYDKLDAAVEEKKFDILEDELKFSTATAKEMESTEVAVSN